MELKGQNILVFDCEIKNEIKNGIKWTDYDKMGMSVTASYNFRTDDYKIYFDDNFSELIADLHSAEMVTGFNIKGFDIPLIETIGKFKLSEKIIIYDMLEVSRKSVGNMYANGLKLDNHLESIFGSEGMKSNNGAMAPIMWQEKQIGSLCSYVLRDVNREKALFEHIWQNGWVKTETHGQKNVKKLQEFLVIPSVSTAAKEAIVNAKDFKLGF